jgi:hypothetical protein
MLHLLQKIAVTQYRLMHDKFDHDRKAANSKIARTIVMGGLVVSFAVIIIGETLIGVKRIVTKPFFRKRDDNVGRSSDLY